MICRDISFISPQENILYDDALLSWAEKEQGPETLRFWESPCDFIVLGRICKPEEDLNWDAVKEAQIPVLRRASGGGTVIQGRGSLNYSLVLSKGKHARLKDLKDSYAFISEKVIAALKSIGVEVGFFPISDIALLPNRKKVSGNAQRRMRHHILHHGTLLYDFDLQKISTYLAMPKSIPEYRENRSHLDFVSNIGSLNIEGFKRALMDAFELKDCLKDLTDTEQKAFVDFQQGHKLLDL